MKPYKTVLMEGEAELSIQKSRFIGYVMPVETEQEAVQFIETIKKRHYNATHNVPVYLLGEEMRIQRYSDDGEPSGTAGVPILEMLKKEGITNVCIVVTRYFGGIKLGTGGLVRAYTDSAKAALEAGKVVQKSTYREVSLTMDYHFHGKVQNALMTMPEVHMATTEFSDVVILDLYCEEGFQDQVASVITELSAGQIEVSIGTLRYLTLADGKLLEL